MNTESAYNIETWKDEYGCWQYRIYRDGYPLEPDAWDFQSRDAALEWARSQARTEFGT